MLKTVGDSLELFQEPAYPPGSSPARPVPRIAMRTPAPSWSWIKRLFCREGTVDAVLFLLTFLLAGWICLCLQQPFSRVEAPAPVYPVQTAAVPPTVPPLQGY